MYVPVLLLLTDGIFILLADVGNESTAFPGVQDINRLSPTKGQTSIPGSAVLRLLHLPAPITTPEILTLTNSIRS